MKDLKNIDRLFLKNLKGLEVSPSPKVWSEIEAKLKKKKRRVAPLWWFYGTAAVVSLMISLLVFNSTNGNPEELIFAPKEIITTLPKNKKEEVDTTSVKTNIPSIEKEKIEIAKAEPNRKDNSKIVDKKKAKKELKTPEKENLLAIKQKQVDTKKPVEKLFPSNNSTDTIQNKAEKKKSTLLPKKDFLSSLDSDSLEIKDAKKKWSVTPVFAFLSSASSGNSPVSSTLSGNQIAGNSNFSYGMKLNYQLSSKFTLQTGIHLQKISFTTKNIALASSSSNVDPFNNLESSSENLLLFPTDGLVSQNDAIQNASLVSDNGVLNQSIDYIEIPFEVTYSLAKGEKLNTSLIGGFSTLFLSSNQVDFQSEKFSQTLGEATNLNTFNFSGNFGIGFDYTFSKKWTFNFNPMIKVHLNTFSENSNGFRPYFFGVYSGIKFSF